MKFKNPYRKIYTWRYCSEQYMSQKKIDIELETYKTYNSKFNVFNAWLDSKKLSSMNVNKTSIDHVSNFFRYMVDERHVSKKTLHEYKELFKTTCKHFVKIGLMKSNPFELLPRIKYKNDIKKPQIMSDNVLQIIKDYFLMNDKQMWMVCQFIFYCFIRPKELRFLKVGDIDFLNGYVTVRGEIAKNDKTQTVIIPDNLLEYLKSEGYHTRNKIDFVFQNGIYKNKAVGRSYFSNQYRKMRKETGIDFDIKFYSLKHTGGVKLKKSGADLIEMKKQFRHYSIEQTYQYICSLENEDSEHIRKKGFII